MEPKHVGVNVTLDGHTYTVPPLTLGALRRHAADLKKVAASVEGAELDDELIDAIVAILHAAMVRNYPDITQEQLLEMVDMANFRPAFEAVMASTGLERAQGNAVAPASTRSAGEMSTDA